MCGQLGDGTTEDRDQPVQTKGVKGAMVVAAGEDFSVVAVGAEVP